MNRVRRLRIVYVSPNRSHHYRYAEGLERAGLLHRFVSGFPRCSGEADALEVPREKVVRCDGWQLLFVAGTRWGLSLRWREWLNTRSKLALDAALSREMKSADLGLFYNGTGLQTVRRYRGSGKLFICEAVNAHVVEQRRILQEEANRSGFAWEMSDAKAIPRRVAEYTEADFVLGPSRFVRESFVREGIAENRFLLNPYGFSMPAESSGAFRRDSSTFTVLYVGQLNFRKGLRYLVEAFDRLTLPGKRLRLVGPEAPPTGLENLSLPDGVERVGVLKGQELAEAYATADVFVQPSLEEGLSLVLGEAMGAGLPVVATSTSGAEEVVADGESGWIVPPRDADALVVALERLAENAELRREMGKKGRQIAQGFGGWRASGDHLAELLEKTWRETRGETD